VGTALWLTQAVAPHMRERGSGAIVHVAARPGLEPTAGVATYSVRRLRGRRFTDVTGGHAGELIVLDRVAAGHWPDRRVPLTASSGPGRTRCTGDRR
jgi:NAD(P)-dependent dehydrogenase (short-subunit alcohol dehydrogenase family)